jgi:hypothetical protein
VLCRCSHITKFPKWASPEPGPHDLHFIAGRRETASSFDKRFVLEDGDVVVAVCAPIESKLIRTQRRPADCWYLGILSTPTTSDSISQRGCCTSSARFARIIRVMNVK